MPMMAPLLISSTITKYVKETGKIKMKLNWNN